METEKRIPNPNSLLIVMISAMHWGKYSEKLRLRRDVLASSIASYTDEISRIEKLLHIPDNATLRLEYVSCGNERCSKEQHGPYCYAYWKEKGKLRKRYLGADFLQMLDPEDMDESMTEAIEDSYNERMSRYTSSKSGILPKFLELESSKIDWDMLAGLGKQ